FEIPSRLPPEGENYTRARSDPDLDVGEDSLEIARRERLGQNGNARKLAVVPDERARIAGHEDEAARDPGLRLAQVTQAVGAVTVREPHVAQHQVERLPRADQLRLLARAGFGDGEIAPRQQPHQQVADGYLVFDHQRLAASAQTPRRRARHLEIRRGWPLRRQRQLEARAAPLGRTQLQRPAVRRRDPEAERQAETRALPHLLRREERLEHAAAQLLADPRPVVGHLERVRVLAGSGADDAASGTIADGVLGVQHEVQHDLLYLFAVDDHRQDAGMELQLERDVVLRERVRSKPGGRLGDLIEIGARAILRALADERQQV